MPADKAREAAGAGTRHKAAREAAGAGTRRKAARETAEAGTRRKAAWEATGAGTRSKAARETAETGTRRKAVWAAAETDTRRAMRAPPGRGSPGRERFPVPETVRRAGRCRALPQAVSPRGLPQIVSLRGLLQIVSPGALRQDAGLLWRRTIPGTGRDRRQDAAANAGSAGCCLAPWRFC